MKCFTYMRLGEFDNELCCRILKVMTDLKYYFVKFNGAMADVAMQKTLHHALSHYCDGDGELVPYIKKLARTILKVTSKATPYECIEEVVRDTTEDIATTVVNTAFEKEQLYRVNELALVFMHYYLLLCNSFINKDEDTRYFPKEFRTECLKLVKVNSNFSQACLSVYDTYSEHMRTFLALEGERLGEWRETDYSLVEAYQSKRVRLVTKAGQPFMNNRRKPVADLDTEEWYVAGKFEGKLLVKINYVDIWDTMCDLIGTDVGINQMKFTMGNSYVIRTLGGSWSVINPVLNHEYELCLDEILTNLIHYTSGRYLGRGTHNMYFLVDNIKKIEDKVAMGIKLSFTEVDITEQAKQRIYIK